jgi:hypothetical protein
MDKEKQQKMNITAELDGKEIDLTKVMVTMLFEGQKAEVDGDTIVRRSLHLVYENEILRKALSEAKAVFEAQKRDKSRIILPGSE